MTTLDTPAGVEPVEAVDLTEVDRIVAEHGTEAGAAIPILQALQARFRYLPRPALERVCELTDISPVRMQGISTFYAQFRHIPMGQHLVSVCHGTACHVSGAQAITDALHRHLQIAEGDDTDPQKLFTVQKVACLGCCSLAPVMSVDGEIYGHLTQEGVGWALERFLRSLSRPKLPPERIAEGTMVGPRPQFRVSLVSCCVANGTMEVREALLREVERLGSAADVKCAGCVGLCDIAPFIDYIAPDGRLVRYAKVDPAAVREIVRRHVHPSGLARRAKGAYDRAADLLFTDAAWRSADDYDAAHDDAAISAFLGKQEHVVMEGSGRLDPLDLAEYEERGGYEALRKCLAEMTPEQVIATVEEAGLRGRGGAGYPAGAKWRTTARQPDDVKYIIMNGDEGDPGAFMDRTLLEAFPHRVLEGMVIAAYAVGAHEAYLYIRHEYPRATERILGAIDQATTAGYLGDDVLGSGFGLRLHVREGAGAFVCGEETGLMASIEGRRGTPRFRPPYPSELGLWGRPTCINNVETYANVPWIIRNGPAAFAAIGTPESRGTKVFALAGAVRRGGLIEVPMGITVREIVEEIGGGVPDGHAFKAVQVGGPSGGCIPAALADTPVDYEDLTARGAMMGSGGIVVLDDTACMVDVARYFLDFTQNESCGKCTFCRVGTRRMLEILERLCKGATKARDLDELEALAGRVARASLCGLGRTAPNPVLTTLRYFRDEYEAHVDGRCPARRCVDLITFTITDRCIGCTRCAQHCPADAIEPRPYERHEIDQDACVRCGTCKGVCPVDAVEVE